METEVSLETNKVVIGSGWPTVLIGERINPTGRKKLAMALEAGDIQFVREQALIQVRAGADILDINLGLSNIDQATLIRQVTLTMMDTVKVPLCFDSNDPLVLEAALEVYRGKPIINSVTGQERSLESVLPLVKKYGTAVIGLTMDDDGIPKTSDKRVAIAEKIVKSASSMGISNKDILIDCLTLTVGVDTNATLVTFDALHRIRAELGVNTCLGASNISFGLPDRNLINGVFLAIAIAKGVSCVIIDAERMRPVVLATELLMGRDKYAVRYTRAYRERKKRCFRSTNNL